MIESAAAMWNNFRNVQLHPSYLMALFFMPQTIPRCKARVKRLGCHCVCLEIVLKVFFSEVDI